MSAVQDHFPHSGEENQERPPSKVRKNIGIDATQQNDFAIRSFRIARSDFDHLQKEAKERDISVSLVVEEAIRRHVEYDQVLKKFRVMHLASSQLGLLADSVSEDKILEIAQAAASDPLLQDWPFVIEVSGENSAKGILNTMKLLAKYDAFDVSEIDYGSKRIVFFAHDAGHHWSLFFATLWKTVFELAGIKVKAKVDDRAAIFEFESSLFA